MRTVHTLVLSLAVILNSIDEYNHIMYFQLNKFCKICVKNSLSDVICILSYNCYFFLNTTWIAPKLAIFSQLPQSCFQIERSYAKRSSFFPEFLRFLFLWIPLFLCCCFPSFLFSKCSFFPVFVCSIFPVFLFFYIFLLSFFLIFLFLCSQYLSSWFPCFYFPLFSVFLYSCFPFSLATFFSWVSALILYCFFVFSFSKRSFVPVFPFSEFLRFFFFRCYFTFFHFSYVPAFLFFLCFCLPFFLSSCFNFFLFYFFLVILHSIFPVFLSSCTPAFLFSFFPVFLLSFFPFPCISCVYTFYSLHFLRAPAFILSCYSAFIFPCVRFSWVAAFLAFFLLSFFTFFLCPYVCGLALPWSKITSFNDWRHLFDR